MVPATGWAAMLNWYDPLVARCTNEKKFKAHMLHQAVLEPGARVLDLGCGSGTLALKIASAQPAATVVGLDADPRILAQARRKKHAGHVRWVLGNAVKLEFPQDSFEYVFCSLLLHHLGPADKQRALAEIARVLVPQGRLILADYCRPASCTASLRFLPVRMIDGWHRTACNVRGRIPYLIREAGFTNVRVTMTLSSILGTLRCFHAARESSVLATKSCNCASETS